MALYKWSKAILRAQPVTVYGDGSQKRDFTYVGDIVDGTMLAAKTEDAVGEIFNLAAGRTVDLKQVLSELKTALGESDVNVSYEPAKPWDPPATHADITKARRILGYEPHTSFEHGLERFADWFKAKHEDELRLRKGS